LKREEQRVERLSKITEINKIELEEGGAEG